ncbi:hypothetical protein [Aliiroseovarius sp. F47248L]|uniref:hypothetical protein n=1 Tax=Aliiroseovarius sp. F47248L TaxID=2926420 RepID=UPI001FF4EF50|nr:hypothetical protein [Aliiroseovarius sp. F47248L]MCK0138812.1 hypothetical protein [Aliiroseovarius sp. F47248L]
MRGYRSIDDFWEYLGELGVLGPAGKALLAMLLAGCVLLIGAWLYSRYQQFRIGGGFEGHRARSKIKRLRTQGQLEGEFTYADALELTKTGTIRTKSLADKIIDCIVPIEILFSSTEHDLIYQLEMEYRSEKEVAGWVEVSQTLNLTDISKVLEEVVLVRNIVCHPEFSQRNMPEDETLYDNLRRRALELHDEFAKIDGVARLRSASVSYLSKHAPHMLPLPTW